MKSMHSPPQPHVTDIVIVFINKGIKSEKHEAKTSLDTEIPS